MTLVVAASPTPILQFFSDDGTFLVGGQLFTSVGGVPYPTYADPLGQIQHANPIILNNRGEIATSSGQSAQLYLIPNVTYTFALFDAQSNPIDTPTNVQGQLTFAIIESLLTQNVLGQVLYPQTQAEQTANVIPSNYAYQAGDPLRYGAIGDGVADDTAAVAAFIAVLNAQDSQSTTWAGGLTYLVNGALPPFSSSNIAVNSSGSTIQVVPNSWGNSEDGTTVLSFTGTGIRVSNLTVDGNQANFTGSGWIGRLFQGANDFRMENCSFINSPFQGVRLGGSKGQFTNCHIDDNANAGIEFDTGSYFEFFGCTFNRNGYGLNGTWNASGPVGSAFGVVLRFRTHHCVFVGCEALQNGLDGISTGQGSYAIKYIGCTANLNNDGGFTMQNNTTAGGSVPGDGESPYDVEFVDCEAGNNYGSGLVSYHPAFNITISGGRYYNNWRAAGQIATISSGVNGVYFAAGSLGINVETKAYDDRQFAGITTSIASGASQVLTLTGWIAGTFATNPRVSFYDSSMNFKGYGTITAEGTNTITVTSTVNDGVVLANIIFGWNVTQRTQHNGVFFDNNCQGSIDVDGFGQLAGPQPYMGWKSISGYNDNGQNVLLPSVRADSTELLLNPGWDTDETNWTFANPTGSSHSRITTGTVRSAGAEQLVGGTSVAMTADAGLITSAMIAASNAYVEASVWCYCDTFGGASMTLFWNPGAGALGSTVNHPGGGWRKLVVGGFMPPSPTQMFMRISAPPGLTAVFDTASMRIKADPTDNRDVSYPIRNPALA